MFFLDIIYSVCMLHVGTIAGGIGSLLVLTVVGALLSGVLIFIMKHRKNK